MRHVALASGKESQIARVVDRVAGSFGDWLTRVNASQERQRLHWPLVNDSVCLCVEVSEVWTESIIKLTAIRSGKCQLALVDVLLYGMGSGTFPIFFRGGSRGKSSEAAKNIGNVPESGRRTLHGGNFRKQSPKTLGNVPEFFWGRQTLGEIFRGSPQKHSGTFPNFFQIG